MWVPSWRSMRHSRIIPPNRTGFSISTGSLLLQNGRFLLSHALAVELDTTRSSSAMFFGTDLLLFCSFAVCLTSANWSVRKRIGEAVPVSMLCCTSSVRPQSSSHSVKVFWLRLSTSLLHCHSSLTACTVSFDGDVTGAVNWAGMVLTSPGLAFNGRA